MDLAYASLKPSGNTSVLQEFTTTVNSPPFHSLPDTQHLDLNHPVAESPLMMAVRTGNTSDVLSLLQRSADPNDYDVLGETPLFEAVLRGQADVIACLLLHNADVNICSAAGNTPRDIATSGSARGLLAFFGGEDLTDEQCDFLLDSLSISIRETVQHEMNERAANRRGLTNLDTAGLVRLPDGRPLPRPLPPLPPEVKQARDAAAAKDLSQVPLACAARAADVDEVLHLLTNAGEDPNLTDEFGETPLFEAAASGNADVVAALLLNSADPNKRSLAGGRAADFATFPPVKTLLAFFSGSDPSVDEKHLACQSIKHPDLHAAVMARLRVGSMQEALQRTLRKLRA